MNPVHGYLLSANADEDLVHIFDYSEAEFGSTQAVTYLTEIDNCINQLVADPELGRVRDEIRIGLRSMLVESHIVFYRILPNHIRIVRILHGSRDLPKFL